MVNLKDLQILLFAVLVSCYLFSDPILAQENSSDSIPRFTDVFIPTGILDYDAEFYYIDSNNYFLEHHFILQPIISDRDLINIEFGIAHSKTPDGNFTVPADLSVSYQRNIKSSRYNESGFQGIGPRLKFIIPTGRGEYLSGFDSWSLEPALVTGFLLKDPRWFTTAEIRYNYSFASLPNTNKNPDFLRAEGFFGYEDDQWWFRLRVDYRLRTRQSENNLFIGSDFSIKINEDIGLKAQYKFRVAGSNFWKHFASVGGYYFF